jgi:hypothetical protein
VLDAVYLYLNPKTVVPQFSFFLHPLKECLPLVRVARFSLYYADSWSSLDVFYGLTAVRVLSIIAILLAFASSIVALVSDVRAVNRSQHDAHSSDGACGYIGFAYSLRLAWYMVVLTRLVYLPGAAQFLINLQVFSGQWSTVFSSSSNSSFSSFPSFRGRWPSSTAFSRSSVLNLASAHSGFSRHCK